MKLLLDTCTFLWILEGSDKLSNESKKQFLDSHNQVFLSVISVWEIMVKFKLGRLPLPSSPRSFIAKQRETHGIESISLEETSIWQIENLPLYHKDPFDRMLIAQAIDQGLAILTPDELITQYPVKTMW